MNPPEIPEPESIESEPSGRPPLPSLMDRIRARTPARILSGPVRGAYQTSNYLQLRMDHAAAKDAVRAEFDLVADFGIDFVTRWKLFETRTCAHTKQEYLLRPELGRALAPTARDDLLSRCTPGADIQIVIADGLSSAAVRVQVPSLLPRLEAEATRRGWRFGQPFFVRHGRVGIMNDVGSILDPSVVILLIGERPGLATAESLSAYMAFRPRPGDDDSRRNLISNIHARGIPPDEATARIAGLAESMMRLSLSGVAIKEQRPAETELPAPDPRAASISQLGADRDDPLSL